MKNALSLACMFLAGILLSTSSFAQSNMLFNPDYNGDGFIGVDDILGALSFYDTAWDGPVSPSWSCGDPLGYAGVDYSTVQIGDLCWFAENLRTTTYLNGDAIPQNLSNGDWSSTTSGAMAFYNDGPAYGGLYNWFAVDDARGLCPSGWHVPTDEEWMTMEMALGMSEADANSTGWRGTDQGTQMKTTYGWYYDGNGTNSSGFSGMMGGGRTYLGGFGYAGLGIWWSSSPNGSNAWYHNLNSNYEGVYRNYDVNQQYGFSVRCVRVAEVVVCTSDADSDGICDDVDPCVGSLDACGVCNGPGAIYDCGCSGIPVGDCDCDGNQLDALGVCGGSCSADADGDGICDDVDPCVGALDACGVCNGPGEIYECGCSGIPVDDCDCYGNQLDAIGVCGGSCLSDPDGDGICGESDPAQFECGNVRPYQGYDYATVLIGDQCWFAENLRTTTYLNGEAIPQNLSDGDWYSTTSGAMAFYNNGNDPAYGGLYNWYAVGDARGLCPSGWHVPTDGEWTILTDHLGGESFAGIQMKTTYGWLYDGNGTNSSGFSGLPGGTRNANGLFSNAGFNGVWWSSSPIGSNAWYRALFNNDETVNRFSLTTHYGFSVRCVRDAE